jgi:3-oxoacyl-[acyl-carrier protein] reductase
MSDLAAVVTGAAQGIGLAICQRFIEDGARVVAFDRNKELLERSASNLGERCVAVIGDVARREDCKRAIDTCVQRFGKIDVMAAHCGIAEPVPLLEETESHWRRHMAVNVDGVMWCTVEAARAMVAADQPGSIVITASINGWHVEETMAAYNTTKGALLAFIRSAAIDLGPHNIRVNGVAPGVVDTPISAMVINDPVVSASYLNTIPLGRFGQASDIAKAVFWLASSDASYISGHTIVLDGGQTLGIRGSLSND